MEGVAWRRNRAGVSGQTHQAFLAQFTRFLADKSANLIALGQKKFD